MKHFDQTRGLLEKHTVENAAVSFLLRSSLKTFHAGGLALNSIDILSEKVIVSIISQLQVEPRASITKLYFINKQEPSEIAQILDLSETEVVNQVNLFRALLLESLYDEGGDELLAIYDVLS